MYFSALFDDAVGKQLHYIPSNDTMTDELKKSDVLSQRLPGGAHGNHEKPQ
jgi:hypothetical protein